ncbi:MAG: MFS transporter [Duganella sp.]
MSGSESQRTSTGTGGAWAPLRHPVFRALWLAGSVANMGLWMQNVAAAWAMTSLTTSPLMVALIQTAATLPAFLLGLPGGVLADLVDRRRLLLAANIWILLTMTTLSVLSFGGWLNAWSLLLLTFALGAGSTLQAPAWQATTSDVLPREQVPAGVSLAGISMNSARAAGPALAGLLIAGFGSGAVFAINALCYFSVIIVLLRWKQSARRGSSVPPEGLIGGIQSGLRYVRHSPALRVQYGRCLVVYFGSAALWALLPVVARDQLGFGADGYGLLLACLGIGAVIGGLLLARLQARFGPNPLMQASNLLFAAVTLCLAYVHVPALVCAALVIGGFSWIGISAVPSAAIQTGVPPWVRARAIAVFFLTFQIAMAAGGFLWGLVADHFGTDTALAAAASLALLSVEIGRRFPIRISHETEVTPSLHWREPTVEVAPAMEDGPVAVQVGYHIDPARRIEFVQALHALGTIRQRDGASAWRLYRDLEAPDRYVERFIVGSWGEYLRQRTRATQADQQIEERAAAFHIEPTPPRMLHFITEAAPQD